MKIQILGTGCPKCKKLAENAEAERIFRRQLFAAGDGLPRDGFGEYMDLALAFQREVRV